MIGKWIIGAGAAVALAAALSNGFDAEAQQVASLEGSWNGSGTVTFASGASETARCRASFSKRSGDQFAMNAVCASQSGRVAQTAHVQRISATRFAGEFQNAEYGVTGSINITLRGNSLSAALDGGGATASLSLSR